MPWIRKTRDTGWYDISTFAPDRIAGRLLVKKEAGKVMFVLDELALTRAGQVAFTRLPGELQPRFRIRDAWYEAPAGSARGTISIAPNGYFNVYDVLAGVPMSAYLQQDLLRPEMTEMPGVKL